MIEINLLPDVKQEFVRTQRTKRLIVSGIVLISVISMSITGILIFYTYVAQPLRQNIADAEINKIGGELQSNKDLTRDLTLQNQLAVLGDVHAQKGNFSSLFEIAKAINPAEPNNVRFSKMDINPIDNTILLEGRTQDYNAISVFRDTMVGAKISYNLREDGEVTKQSNKQLFSDIVFSNVGVGKDEDGASTASFKVTASYEPDIFSFLASQQKVSIPKQNTTPSAENVSLFSDEPAAKKEGQ